MPEDEIISLDIVRPDGSKIEAEILIWEADPQDPEKVKVILRFDNKELEYVDSNFFYALVLIRQELDKDNLLLHCYGASRNVYPSSMALNMGTGEMAYKLTLGKKARQEDLVSIFDVGSDVVPVTVSEQEKFYEDWMKSLSKE